MEDLKSNKMFWVLVVVTIFNIGAFLLGKVVVDKAADRVIQKLQKEYSPSPYGPGFDPDKVSPDAFKAQKQYFELRKQSPSKVFFDEGLRGGTETPLNPVIQAADDWRDDWEKSRGANPER
jgi:hypothetical protein